MALYHFSEDPAITRFVPRPPLARPDVQPAVWAIDAWHTPLYYLPRDCPRVCFWPQPKSTAEDIARFFAYVPSRMVIAIEAGWLARVRETQLYRYVLPDTTFTLEDAGAGYYISRDTVIPEAIEPLGDLLVELAATDVELRVCSSLVPLGRAVVASSLHFSLIRMRNAMGWGVVGSG